MFREPQPVYPSGSFEVIRLKLSRSFACITIVITLFVIILIQPVSAAGVMESPPGYQVPGIASAINPALHDAGTGSGTLASNPVLKDTRKTIPGMQTPVGAGAASRTLLERTRNVSFPFISSLVLFAVIAGISAVLILFARRRFPAEPGYQQPGGTPYSNFLAAGAYILLGSMLAVLSILVMTALMATASGSVIVTGGKVFCALCFYLSVSSFFQAQSILHSESFPAITSIHGALAAFAIVCFVLLVIDTPERRGITLFSLIVVLAASAGLPLWQNRRHQQPQPSFSAVVVRKPEPQPVRPSVTLISPVGSGRESPGREQTDQSSAGPVSGFPPGLKSKYYDVSYVGSGGFAMVFSATRKTDGEKVAIKIPISHNEATGKSFLNEIRVWETLHHPNIVRVTAVNILPVPYVEMEFVPSSLEAIQKPVPLAQALKIIIQVADALSYAHRLGIVHRDIKPHNILLTSDLTPKLTDWGMSKDLFGDANKKSSVVGYSMDYAAPEQLSPVEFGKTDQRTDIFQLGVVFYELVTGSMPFGENNIVDTGDAILHKTPVIPSERNPEAAAVDGIILKCLEKEPSKRFQSATGIRDALSLVEAGKLPVEYSVFSLSGLVTRVLESGDYAMMADIVTEVPHDLLVEGDSDKLATVLSTLVSNAVRYSKPPRKIRVTYRSSPDDGYHHLAVQDNGTGITDARLDSIFKMSGVPVQDDTNGVSLSIAKKYVQMHGGYISVDSIANIGSTFTVHIPKNPQKPG